MRFTIAAKGMFAHKALTVASAGKSETKGSRKAATEVSFGLIRRLISLDVPSLRHRAGT